MADNIHQGTVNPSSGLSVLSVYVSPHVKRLTAGYVSWRDRHRESWLNKGAKCQTGGDLLLVMAVPMADSTASATAVTDVNNLP